MVLAELPSKPSCYIKLMHSSWTIRFGNSAVLGYNVNHSAGDSLSDMAWQKLQSGVPALMQCHGFLNYKLEKLILPKGSLNVHFQCTKTQPLHCLIHNKGYVLALFSHIRCLSRPDKACNRIIIFFLLNVWFCCKLIPDRYLHSVWVCLEESVQK